MKILIALAILVLAVAEAHHSPLHTLRGPRFKVGKLYEYDVEFNVTSGVLGLSSQVSVTAFKAVASIYAKTEREHLLKIEKVYTSDSEKGIESKYGYIPMHPNRELEDRLSIPIHFTLENGEVTSYTLSPRETLQSKKIKKSILRSLEMHVPEYAHRQLESDSLLKIPITYNITEESATGDHIAQYMINVSPYVEFPDRLDVFNITHTDDYESIRYPGHIFHHNFRSQGCPEVCKVEEWETNKYGAGCPFGHEPHQSPVKMYFNHEHHLSLKDQTMNPEIIKTTEVHVAQMYDQDMEILIRYQLTRKSVSERTISEQSGQQTFNDLKDWKVEIDEEEIDKYCDYKSPREVVESVKNLLKEIARIIISGDLEDKRSTIIGEKTILLKQALTRLSVAQLEEVARTIVKQNQIKQASEEETVKRQLWMDILPLIGTEEAVTFIVKYLNQIDESLLVWEAKEILEALPENIETPNEKIIQELRTLLNLRESKKEHLLHSAVHLTLARVIGQVCENATLVPFVQSRPLQRAPWFGNYQQSLSSLQSQRNERYDTIKCPESLVSQIIQEVTRKLYNTEKQEEIAVYLGTLSHIGVPEVLPILAKYAYGVAENLQKYSLSYIDFVKTVTLYTLHNIAEKYPQEIQQIVVPIYFNSTEVPKVRMAAFGVLIRAQPPLYLLQHVASNSWTEKSNEVGSFVTATLETFGNTSIPCMQLTSERIQKILPQLKRFDIGLHHAKNYMWSYFDDLREFGLEKRFAFYPSNESIIPSAIYHSLSYSMDSLRDTIVQLSLNIQGLTQEKIFNQIDRLLGLRPTEGIEDEEKVFGQANIVERVPEKLRFTLYRRMFYSSSYYYFDSENILERLSPLLKYLDTYMKRTSMDYSGHLVKMFIPSSFHTVAIAKTLPYPVEFQMQQPLILALKVKSLERHPSRFGFNFQVRPSLYYTKLYTHQFKNLADCKEIGVYHENKIAVSYPLEVKFDIRGLLNATMTYKVPELEKKVFVYFSEAGTYAAAKKLEILPSTERREPIRTIPTPFQYVKNLNLIGVPPMEFELHSEDIGILTPTLPRTPFEAFDMAVQRILNAGWRYQALNVTLREDRTMWPRDTKVTLNFEYSREHFTKTKVRMSQPQESSWYGEKEQWNSPPADQYQSQWNPQDSTQTWNWRNVQDSEDWEKDLKPEDVTYNKNPTTFIEQGKKASRTLSLKLPHIYHFLNVEVQTEPIRSTAYFTVEYNHTHSRSLQSVYFNAAVKPRNHEKSHEITIDHIMAFLRKPNEFKYDTFTGNQLALFITGLRLQHGGYQMPWENVETVVKGVFRYESLRHWLQNELLDRLEEEYFLPETHEECLKDVREGKPLSMDCVKAIREHSIYNKLNMTILWNRRMPEVVAKIANRADLYTKYAFFSHLNLTDEENTENRISIALTHIDKFTDIPVFDVEIRKPKETVRFQRIESQFLQPFSSIYNVWQMNTMETTNNTYPPTCVMMTNFVRTYDLKTYPFPADKCSYVLSAHCAPHKHFAVIAKVLDARRGTKEIHLHIGKHTIVMAPKSGRTYKIRYDGREYTVQEPLVFEEDTAEIYAFTEEYRQNEQHLHVFARKAGVRVTYDGQNVKVQIDTRYKGEMCGLCSEFDGEIAREYRGVDRCLYTNPLDFANSAIINKNEGSCQKRLQEPRLCDGENEVMSRRKTAKEDTYAPTTKRNIVLAKGDEYCFSILPVPICDENAEPIETEMKSVAFHCLPKRDVTARKMLTESKRRVLGEIAGKRADFEQSVDVAKMC